MSLSSILRSYQGNKEEYEVFILNMEEYTKTTTGIEQRIPTDLVSKISEMQLSDLSCQDYERVAKNYLIQNLTEQFGFEVRKSNFNIDEMKRLWLDTLSSEITKRNYSHNVDDFFRWFASRSVIELNSVDADRFLVHLKGQDYSDGSIRFKIASISSFCSYLVRHGVLQYNYFQKMKLPRRKIEIKSHEEIPTEEEVQIIEQELLNGLAATGKGSTARRRASKILLLAIMVIKDTACRIGALPSMTIDKDGNYVARSKGKYVRGKVTPITINRINEQGLNPNQPFSGVKTETLKKHFEILNKRLYRQGVLRRIFSPHCIRHYSAIAFWNKTHDIYQLKRLLNHESIATSQIYLSSLNVES